MSSFQPTIYQIWTQNYGVTIQLWIGLFGIFSSVQNIHHVTKTTQKLPPNYVLHKYADLVANWQKNNLLFYIYFSTEFREFCCEKGKFTFSSSFRGEGLYCIRQRSRSVKKKRRNRSNKLQLHLYGSKWYNFHYIFGSVSSWVNYELLFASPQMSFFLLWFASWKSSMTWW